LEQEELAGLITQTAALMEQFQQRTESIDTRLQELAQQLAGLADQLPYIVRQSADDAMQSIPSQVVGQTQTGLSHVVMEYQDRWGKASKEVGSASQLLSQRINALERLHRSLIWKTVGVALVSLIVLIGAAVWISMHFTDIIRENQISAELLKAYNRADVALCDNGKLCANVDIKGKRFGENREYLPVVSR
jgi:uncharacterized phage infection (PIP) family protein YhgE